MPRRRVALFDWDGTVYEGYSLVPWVKHLVTAGFFPKDRSERLAELFADYSKRQIDHDQLAQRTAEQYACGLVGQPASGLVQHARTFIPVFEKGIREHARDVFPYLNDRKIACIVVSGAPALLLRESVHKLLIEATFGLELEQDRAGRMTGMIARNTGLSAEKRQVVADIEADHEIVCAFGDSASDVPLFEAAEFGLMVGAVHSEIPESLRSRVRYASPAMFMEIIREQIP